ncbi:MAG TPA: hypothetical protein VMY42_12145 [Thermoguttaceae bacterium]|nr:hypothetical protein [Thermoguttaceae bacterium]
MPKRPLHRRQQRSRSVAEPPPLILRQAAADGDRLRRSDGLHCRDRELVDAGQVE